MIGLKNKTNIFLVQFGALFFFELMKGCFFSLGSALVWKEAYQEIGGFDTDLLTSEDYDVQLRLARRHRAAYCNESIFIVREHDGVRGPKGHQYAASQRAEVFRSFDRKVGLKLRAALSLREYANSSCSTPLSEGELVWALFSRAIVMASKGCLAEMFCDLRDALHRLDGSRPLMPIYRRQIMEVLTTGHAYSACVDNWNYFAAEVRSLVACPHGPTAVSLLGVAVLRLAIGHPASPGERIGRLAAAFRVGVIALTSYVMKLPTVLR